MHDIKTKPVMTAPKARKTNVAPKEAADILRKQYTELEKARQPEEKDPVRYATDQTETDGGRGAVLAAAGTRRAVQRIRQRRESEGHTTGTVPKKENAPPAQTSSTPKTRGSQTPDKPAFAPKERSFVDRQSRQEASGAARTIHRVREQQLRRQAARKRMAEQVKETSSRVAEVVSNAVKSAASSVAAIGGGAVLVVLTVFVALIAAIVASPFGIFFSNESASSDTVPLSAAVAQVNYDFNARLEELQGADAYDDITVDGSTADWVEILAVFAAKVAGCEGADAADVATIDADRIDRLKAVFWDMNALTSEVETIDHPDSDPDDDTDDSWTEKILHITVTPKIAADMPTVYGFTTRQTDAMNELLAERAALMELVGNLTAFSVDAADVMKRLPANLSPERREVVRVACSLVGKVAYFWGGCALLLDNLRRNTQ